MPRPARRRLFLTCLGLLAACGRSPLATLDDAGAASDGPAPLVDARILPQCVNAETPANDLECTGLYADMATKQLAEGVTAYAPAIPLWSDGAEKKRWIALPPGTTIDTSDPNEWVFPVGTMAWKEFSSGGHRVETRLWQKVRANYWVDAAYAWNADESAARLTKGGDIPFAGGTYHIPTHDECEKCHRGRTDRILGFEQIELSLPGANGVTMRDLIRDKRLSKPPATDTLTIGDDGTGAGAPAMGWLHANCGITCHNDNSNSTGFAAKMVLRLDASLLDGRSLAGNATLKTTVGVKVNAPNWNGRPRIVAGDPASSLLYQLISQRGEGKQMPPIASRIIDEPNVALVGHWIASMTPAPRTDAAAPDAHVPDAGVPDAGSPDATPPDAKAPDAAADAQALDAAGVDTGPSTLENGLILHWAFDEAMGLVAQDTSGHNLAGAYAGQNGPPLPSELAPTMAAANPRSRQFDQEKHQGVLLPALPRQLQPGTITLSIWFRSTGLPGGAAQVVTAGGDYGLRIDNAHIAVTHNNQTGTMTCRPTLLGHLEGSWHHVAATIEAQQTMLYFDGRLTSTCGNTGPLAYTAGGTFMVGRAVAGTGVGDFHGNLDDLRLYNRALTGLEVLRLSQGQQ